MKFRIRYDHEHSEEFADEFNDWFYKIAPSSKIVIVSHVLPHGNPHYHVYFDDPMCMSLDVMRKRFARKWSTKRGDYSVVICDEGREKEYVSYMFNEKHGNKAYLVQNDVFTPDEIIELQENSDKIHQEYLVKQKDKKPTIYDYAKEVHEMIHSDDATIAQYTTAALTVLHKYRKSCDPNMLIKIVSTARSFKNREFLIRKVQFYFQEE